MITQNDITRLCVAASEAGYEVNPENLQLLQWRAGLQSHIPLPLPSNYAAVYIFEWNGHYLKVGKVNSKSKSRYHYQHYLPDSNQSTLANSLRKEFEFHAMAGVYPDVNWGEWIKENTNRYNVLIPVNLCRNFVAFAEAFFILKCNPMF
jgi:hypothetical protein